MQAARQLGNDWVTGSPSALDLRTLSAVIGESPTRGRPSRWVLLRGLGRQSRHWFGFEQELEQALGVPCHAVDLPGSGGEHAGRAPTSVEETAAWLRHRLIEPHGGGTRGVLAISFGAMVALSLGRAEPQRISHLVLLNASSRLSSPGQRLRPRALLDLAIAASTREPERRERRIYALTTNSDVGRVADWARQAAEVERQRPLLAATFVRQLLAAARFFPPRVQQRVLVLSATGDRMVAHSCSAALARYLGATHRAHPAAGHDLPLNDPKWVVSETKRWL